MKPCNVLVLLSCVVLFSQAPLASTQDAAVEEHAADAEDAALEKHAADAQDAIASQILDDDVVDTNEVNAVQVNGADSADAPTDDAPIDDAPTDDAPIDDAPIDDAPIDDAPIDDAPIDDAPTADASKNEVDTVGTNDVDSNDVDPIIDDDVQDAAAEDAQDDADTSPAPVDTLSSDATTTTTTAPSSSPISTPPSVSSETLSETWEPPSNRSVAAWFRMGVEAYLSEDWKTCATALENAVQEWQYFLRANIDCRLNCANEARRAAPLFDKDIEHLQHTEELVRNTLCIMKCKRRAFHGRVTTDTIAASDQKAFRDLKTYEYLQLCYYQSLQFQKAASAVFTIISHDPSNDIMRQNLKYYLSMPEVDANKLVNYESEPYVAPYLAGTDAYFSENYASAVSNLEESLQEFLNAVERCRADCEGPFDQGWLPDFTPSITNHYVYCMKCKTRCHSKLSQINGERYDDFLPLHYNYLQFAYFKLGRLKDACAAAATYLLFLPADETMLENIEFYKALPKFETSMFQPRAEAVNYIHRQTYENALLKFVSDEFVFPDLEEKDKVPQPDEIRETEIKAPWKLIDSLQYSTHSAHTNASQKISLKTSITAETQQETLLKETIKPKVYPSANKKTPKWDEYILDLVEAKELKRLKESARRPVFNFRGEGALGGEKRFVVDGAADILECKLLAHFAKGGGVQGDGYDGNKSPHSPVEIFKGMTLGRAALMVYFGLIELSTLKLFMTLSERSKSMIATYFNISNTDLHFSYTHLVCRSALPGESSNGSAFSHKIHADNCWLTKDGRCVQAHPAYYWRDYSALLYLNDDFDGGEFIFTADPSGKLIQTSIKPTCGRLVGFSAGPENLHGVHGVKKGTRCALALWFTLDVNRQEWGRMLTEQMIRYLEAGEQPRQVLISELEYLVEFDLKEAQKQMLQAAPCDEYSEEAKHKEAERKSLSLMKTNHSQH